MCLSSDTTGSILTHTEKPVMMESLTNFVHGKQNTCVENVLDELALTKDVHIEKKSFKRVRPTYTLELLPAKNILESTVLPQESRRNNSKRVRHIMLLLI